MAMSDKNFFDYIVIGGGSAGCVVAARLAEEKLGSVLLLEAGQSAEENPEILNTDGFKESFAKENTFWHRMTLKQPHSGNRPIFVGSGKTIGGGGSVNGMVYTRGDIHDFAQWPASWQWEDVVPAFEAVENRLRVRHRTPTKFTELCIKAALKVGYRQKDSLNDGHLCGYLGYNDMNFEDDQRRSSYVAFIHGREKELVGLTIISEATVNKILFDDQGVATGVEYSKDGAIQTAHIGEELIVSAGALETPKLLMLSGIGPKQDLEKFSIPVVKDVESIGKNLQDHPSVCIFYTGTRPIDFYYPQVYGFTRVNDRLALADGQADTCIALFTAGSVMKHTLLRLMPIMLLPGKLHRIKILRKIIRAAVEIAFLLPMLRSFVARLYGMVVILGKPLSRGELHLQSTNPEDQAAIDMAFFKNPEDMNTMVTAVELTHQISQQSELVEWGNKLLSKAVASGNRKKIEQWIGNSAITVFHYSGTCAMGETATAPVDLNLKLRGIKNLRIADASVVPVLPVSALNAPSMMIGYRAADFIISEHRQRAADHSVQEMNAETG